MVDRQSKHIPPAIHGLPSEINPFWLVLPDQEVVYRTYTAPFTLSAVLPLVFQPFKINKPPGVHFPRISCSGVNPATRIYNVYWLPRINILFMRRFIHYVNLSPLNVFIDYYYIYFFIIYEHQKLWNRIHVVVHRRSKNVLTKTDDNRQTIRAWFITKEKNW